jgi:predicted aspartyl protease
MIRLPLACLAVAALCVGQRLRAEVPLSIAESGHATVPVKIEGVGVFEFVLDTGAEGTALYSPFEADHHLPLQAETTELQGQTGSAPVRLASLPTLTVDGLRAENANASRVPDGAASGIIGTDVPVAQRSISTCRGAVRSFGSVRFPV